MPHCRFMAAFCCLRHSSSAIFNMLCVLSVCPTDYLKKIIVKGLSSATTPVSKIMTAADKLAVLTPEHSVLEAMDLMLRYNVRHVPVVSTQLGEGLGGAAVRQGV